MCDLGWKGATCAVLDLAPASPFAFGFYDREVPSWGGGAVFSEVSMVQILYQNIFSTIEFGPY